MNPAGSGGGGRLRQILVGKEHHVPRMQHPWDVKAIDATVRSGWGRKGSAILDDQGAADPTTDRIFAAAVGSSRITRSWNAV
jgi:hypothetical protein